MAHLYADEDFAYPVVECLRQMGHDVLTAQDAGQAQQRISDAAVLSYASTQGRAVLTFNRRHFIRLHRLLSAHCGIVVCTRDDDSAALAARIHQAVILAPILNNQLFRVNRAPASP